jgi:TonB family protein
MKPQIGVVLLILGMVQTCLPQNPKAKDVPPECTKTTRVYGSFPKGPFKSLRGESYIGSPNVRFLIREDGTVTDVAITRSSGVADIDKKILDAITKWKYKSRPWGCGVIENDTKIIIDWNGDR